MVYSRRGRPMKIDKRLFTYIRHVRFYLIALGGLSMLAAALIILQAHFITLVINYVFLVKSRGFGQGPALSLQLLSLVQGQGLFLQLLLVVIGVRAGLFWFNEMLGHRMATQAKNTLRNRLFEHLL